MKKHVKTVSYGSQVPNINKPVESARTYEVYCIDIYNDSHGTDPHPYDQAREAMTKQCSLDAVVEPIINILKESDYNFLSRKNGELLWWLSKQVSYGRLKRRYSSPTGVRIVRTIALRVIWSLTSDAGNSKLTSIELIDNIETIKLGMTRSG